MGDVAGESPPRSRRLRFALLTTWMVVAIIALLSAFAWRYYQSPASARRVHQRAWEASFRERGLPVPARGPRDGYLSQRVGVRQPHEVLGWVEPAMSIPGLVEIDERGWQHDAPPGHAAHRILVLGGSVAFGSYASRIDTTWFHLLGRQLASDPRSASEIVVVASVAWKSIQEVAALLLSIDEIDPDLVVMLDGLNDLTNGATAETLYGREVPMPEGEAWTPLYHAHDYEARVRGYLDHVSRAAGATERRGIPLLVVLQPALFERAHPSGLEAQLLRASLRPHASRGHLERSYAVMRAGLARLAQHPAVDFLDASTLFAGESATTFADMWHFSDPGQAILARAVARRIQPLLLRERGASWKPADTDIVVRSRRPERVLPDPQEQSR